MTTHNFNYVANRIHIESDIKIDLIVQSADNAESSHSFNCVYPDSGIKLHESLENGTILIKLTKTKSSLPFGKKVWELVLKLAVSGLNEFKLDAAKANLNFNSGDIHNYVCNMANGAVTITNEFEFRNGTINGAMADLSIIAPKCFENLEINLASGRIILCFPASERVVCVQNSIFKSITQTFGNNADEDISRRYVTINGAVTTNSISTY